jgi:hypothetical protein
VKKGRVLRTKREGQRINPALSKSNFDPSEISSHTIREKGEGTEDEKRRTTD